MTVETVERRAVHIAAVVMAADGLCRYEDPLQCKTLRLETSCTQCIERWLLAKAKREIKKGVARK